MFMKHMKVQHVPSASVAYVFSRLYRSMRAQGSFFIFFPVLSFLRLLCHFLHFSRVVWDALHFLFIGLWFHSSASAIHKPMMMPSWNLMKGWKQLMTFWFSQIRQPGSYCDARAVADPLLDPPLELAHMPHMPEGKGTLNLGGEEVFKCHGFFCRSRLAQTCWTDMVQYIRVERSAGDTGYICLHLFASDFWNKDLNCWELELSSGAAEDCWCAPSGTARLASWFGGQENPGALKSGNACSSSTTVTTQFHPISSNFPLWDFVRLLPNLKLELKSKSRANGGAQRKLTISIRVFATVRSVSIFSILFSLRLDRLVGCR